MSLTTGICTVTARSKKSASWLVVAAAGSRLLIARCAGSPPPSVLFTYGTHTPGLGTLLMVILLLTGQNGCRAGLDSVGLDASGRCLCYSLSILPRLTYLGRCSVAQADVRAVVVAMDVGGDLPSCLVEGLELGTPDEPLLELPD